MAQPIDPDDEIFWRNVRDAYNHVISSTGTDVEISVNNRKASVQALEDTVVIVVQDTVPPQRELNVI